MQPTCTRTTLPRRNVTARLAIRAVKKVAGEKAPTIARSSVKPIALRNALREDVLDQSQESVVIW